MRERLDALVFSEQQRGITPARAGKTPELFRLAMDIRDHPRSCGKDCSWGNGHEDSQGSPPLVRERQTAARLRTSPARITPARAGKTTCRSRANPCRRDHPRSCGKDLSAIMRKKSGRGSPPLVRERPCMALIFDRLPGITPARAGKTLHIRC